jgi:hypothetical protein
MGVRTLAAELGVRDFVYHRVIIRKGEAFREVSDGLLLVGNREAILLVKLRESDADTDDKLSSWISKKVDEGVRQVKGTRRTMLREAADLTTPRSLPQAGHGTTDWPDHEQSFQLGSSARPMRGLHQTGLSAASLSQKCRYTAHLPLAIASTNARVSG